MERRRKAEEVVAPSRGTIVFVLIALAIHVGIVTALTLRSPSGSAPQPPTIEGAGSGGATGLPTTSRRIVHSFVVRNADEGRAIVRARVHDVFADEAVMTEEHGVAVLMERPSAVLLVHVEKPGFALYAAQLRNIGPGPERHAVFLKRADVPYYVVDTIFLMRCNYCHGGPSAAGGVDLTAYDRAIRSRHAGRPVIVAGKPDSSLLILALTDSVSRGGAIKSHLKRIGRFPEFDVETLAEWVREGARRIGPP